MTAMDKKQYEKPQCEVLSLRYSMICNSYHAVPESGEIDVKDEKISNIWGE